MSTVVSIIIMLLVLVGAVLGLLWDRRLRAQLRQPFSSAAWQHVDTRWRMLHDLLSTYQLSGLDRQQITDLLGQPDDDGGRIALCFAESEKFKYQHVGYKLSEEDDCDWLVLHFDEDDRVADNSWVPGW